MSANRPIVEVTDLAKSYGRTPVLQSVSFSVAGGEILGLLGRNGAGKTTALECILGLRRPDRGGIALGGIDALRSPVTAREMVGAQLQSAALQDKLTPTQALRYFGSFYPRARPVDALLGEFQLQEKANAPFDSLSGGQKQRLFLALAFVHDPAVVILDEPSAGLDPQSRRELHACILAAKRRGVAILLSTHDLDEAEQLCDRVGILHGGTIVATGEPQALIRAARRQPRVHLTAGEPLFDLRILSARESISEVTIDAQDPRRATIECVDVERALGAALEALVRSGNRLIAVQIRRATLEDVFFESTGSMWTEESEGRAGTSLPASSAAAARKRPLRDTEP